MTPVPKNAEKLRKWSDIFGKRFEINILRYGAPAICRDHFEMCGFGRRSYDELPVPMNHVSTPSVPSESLTNTPSTSSASKKTSRTPLLRKLEALEITEVSTTSYPAMKINDFADSVDAVKESKFDPVYQPKIKDLIQEDCEIDECDEPCSSKHSNEYAYVICDYEDMVSLAKICEKCRIPGKYKTFKSGFVIVVDIECELCGTNWRWSNSKKIIRNDGTVTRRYHLNVALTSTIVSCGSSFSQIENICDALKMPCLSKSSFYSTKRKGVIPAVQSYYDIQMKKIENLLQEIDKLLDLCGDGQFDTRGFSALWCRYVLMDAKTKLILDFENIRKKMGEASKNLEPMAHLIVLERVIERFRNVLNNNNPVQSLTTDRNGAIMKTMEKFEIRHMYDFWHWARNIIMDFWPKRSQKQWKPISNWLQSFVNHLYYSVSSSEGNGEMAAEKVMGFFAHCLGIHENFENLTFFEFHLINKCDHEALDNTDGKGYLDSSDPKDMKAWKLLKDIVTKGNRLTDLKNVSYLFCTSQVESFNSLSTLYAPKSTFFEKSGHQLTSQLAVIHWNFLQMEEMEGRRKVVGSSSYTDRTRHIPKQKKVKMAVKHTWRRAIVDKTIEFLAIRKSQNSSRMNLSDSDDEENEEDLEEQSSSDEYESDFVAMKIRELLTNGTDNSDSDDDLSFDLPVQRSVPTHKNPA